MLPLTYRQALANRRFRLFAIGFGISSLGDGMSALAVAWLAIQISSPADRGLVVGGAVAAYTLPGAAGIFLRRFLGRLDSGRLLLLNCSVRAICLGAISLLAALGRLDVAGYVVLLAASAVLSSWGTAARYALVAETLPEETRLGGNALLGTLLNAGIIAGPAAAGFLTAASGAANVLALDALSWLVYAVCVVIAGSPKGEAEAPSTDARSGLRMILADRTLLGLLILTLAFFFFYGP